MLSLESSFKIGHVPLCMVIFLGQYPLLFYVWETSFLISKEHYKYVLV